MFSMITNRLALAALVVGCLAAAGVGGYLATVRNTASLTPPVSAAPVGIIAEPAEEAPASEAAAPEPARAVPEVARTRTAPPLVRSERSPQPVALPAIRPQTSLPDHPPAAPERSAPTDIAGTAAPVSSASPDPSAVEAPAPVHVEDAAVAPAAIVEPEPVSVEELVVSADSVIGLQLDSTITTERARIEDRVEARVIRDVRVGSDVAIAAGSRALGSVTAVDRGGRFKERARLGIRFHTLVLADGTRLPIATETIYRYGDSPVNSTAAKIGGGAAAGAILGGIVGGAKGAAIGATTGAGAGTAIVVASGRNEAAFASGVEVTARILAPVTVTVEK